MNRRGDRCGGRKDEIVGVVHSFLIFGQFWLRIIIAMEKNEKNGLLILTGDDVSVSIPDPTTQKQSKLKR